MSGAREVDIILRFLAETQDARELNKEMQEMMRTSKEAAKAAGRTGDYYSSEYSRWRHEQSLLSAEARAMQREMSRGWINNSAAYRKAREDMIIAQYGYYKLAQAGKDYMGTTKQMMDQIYALGAAYKKASDAMINNDTRLRQSFMETAGRMANMTTQAQRISDNYTRMANPMYLVNKGHLAIANGLNKIAMNGNAANLALQMLGPTASTKELNDMIMMINQGLMRMTMVAMGAAVTSYFLYRTMHRLAMENENYASALDKMKASALKAFQPMIQVFTDLMIAFFGLMTMVFDAISAFNEANPVLARFIQGILLLIPALTLILSPLAIGIGLFMGYRAALFAVWALIGPLITGMAAMAGTVMLVAGALVALYMYFLGTGEAADSFRAMVDGAIDAVINKVVELIPAMGPVFDWIGQKLVEVGQLFMSLVPYISMAVGYVGQKLNELGVFFSNLLSLVGPAMDALKSKVSEVFGSLVDIFSGLLPLLEPIKQVFLDTFNAISDGISKILSGDFSGLVDIFAALMPTIIGYLVGGIPGLLIAGAKFLPAIADGVLSGAGQLASVIDQLIPTIVNFIATGIPMLVEVGLNIITTLIEGLITAIPLVLEAGIQVIQGLVEAITTALPVLLEAALIILQSLVEGIIMALPILLEAAFQIINMLITSIAELLPMLIELGAQLLVQLINGIVSMLPMLIESAIQIIQLLLDTLVTLLPQLIPLGMQVISQLILGIIQNLPAILGAVLQIFTALVTTIIANLPQILTCGIQILWELIKGIVQTIGELVIAAGKLVVDFVAAVMNYDYASIGKDIIQGILNGLISMKDALIETARGIAESVGNTIKGFFGIASPSKLMKEYGGWITEGLSIGMVAEVPKAVQASGYVSREVMGNFADQTAESGYDVTNNRSAVTNSPTVHINIDGANANGEHQDLHSSVTAALDEFFNYQKTVYGG